AEVYVPPPDKMPLPGSGGVAIDSNGLVWQNWRGAHQMLSFDRRKCKMLNGPNATGQHCPEGWTVYTKPGPTFQGGADYSSTDMLYMTEIDRDNTLGHVQHVRAGIIGASLERGPGFRVDGPTFRAVLPGSVRSIQHLALAAVETQHLMSAPPVLPDEAVAVDGHASRTGQRHFVRRRHVDLRLTRLRRVGPQRDPHELRVSDADARAPPAPLDWVDGIPGASQLHPVVLFGIDRLIGLGPLRDRAVAVGVEHGRTPSLRRSRVVSFVEHNRVDPADRVVLAEDDRALVVEVVM